MEEMEELTFRLSLKAPYGWMGIGTYDVELSRECTIKEFLDCVVEKSSSTWGEILVFFDDVLDDGLEYSMGEILFDFESSSYRKYSTYKIKKVVAAGSMVNINYKIYI